MNISEPTRIILILTMFLPGFILALMSVCNYNGCIKNILSHPSLLLLPIFTLYTFSINRKWSTGKEDTAVTFSRNWTLANIVLSVPGHIAFGVLWLNTYTGPYTKLYLFFFPVAILGVLLTTVFIFLQSCYSTSTLDLQYAVLKTSDPMTEYVVEKDSSGAEVVLTMEEWRQTKNSEEEGLGTKLTSD